MQNLNLIPIFVISLPSAIEKQRLVKTHNEKLGIPFEFVPGVDARAFTESEIEAVFDKNKSINYYKWFRNRTGSAGVGLARGEVGCTLAHRKVYQKMVDEGIEQAIVLEDDILVVDDFTQIIQKVLNALNTANLNSPLIIKLDVNSSRKYSFNYKNKFITTCIYFLSRLCKPCYIKIDDNLKITKTPFNFGGAQIYYINNEAAKKMLSINNPVFLISDEWNYFARFITVRALNCSLKSKQIPGTDIWQTNHHALSVSVPLKYKIIGLFKKILIKIHLLLFR